MGPEWWVVGSVLGAAAVFGSGVWVGWSLVDDRLHGVEDDLARVTAQRNELADRETARARGARDDLARAADVSGAVASGDRERVLRAFDVHPGSSPSEPGEAPDERPGEGDAAS